jgi:hypothetical protein
MAAQIWKSLISQIAGWTIMVSTASLRLHQVLVLSSPWGWDVRQVCYRPFLEGIKWVHHLWLVFGHLAYWLSVLAGCKSIARCTALRFLKLGFCMDITNTALIYIGAGCHNLRELDVYRLVWNIFFTCMWSWWLVLNPSDRYILFYS